VLAEHDIYDELLARWDKIEQSYDHEKAMADHQEKVEQWKQRSQEARQAGRAAPPRPRAPQNQLAGQHRPANLYQGVLNPIIGYGIRGAIWYQGESNAGRAYQYRHLFPLMITTWREAWKQGDFAFYWVQLADFRDEVDGPGDSSWAELREAQTMSLALPNTGQAVIVDLGEGRDIHPRNKQDVAKRLARWALANDYGIDIPCRSPEYKSMEKKGSRIVLTFDHVGDPGLYTFDVNRPVGFAIAGEDKKFVRAEASIVAPDKIEVWSDEVADPVAVRYAWADNPICNVQSRNGLPLTPFRTDDWDITTMTAETAAEAQAQ
jgi:sialate O-acetylesterase